MNAQAHVRHFATVTITRPDGTTDEVTVWDSDASWLDRRKMARHIRQLNRRRYLSGHLNIDHRPPGVRPWHTLQRRLKGT